MTINGTLASMDAVFNTSSARSPPTNIRENGNRHNANAQNKRLAFNGSPITFFWDAAAKIYEPESNVVAKNKNAEIKNNTTINDENGNWCITWIIVASVPCEFKKLITLNSPVICKYTA